jgi:shikimate dehydrogenase
MQAPALLGSKMEAPELYEISDLLGGADAFQRSSPPVRLGVFGDPVKHSRSPIFQNAALKACGIPASYTRLHVDAGNFSEGLRALPAAGFLGANVTMPHNAAALTGVDEADDYARVSGSVNTIVVDGGNLLGFNTDGPGLSRAIREEFHADLKDLRVVLLGAGGGVGRAIAVQCAMESCERLVLVNRSLEKAQSLASELALRFWSEKPRGAFDRLLAIPHEDVLLQRELEHADLLINATALGMKRTDPAVIPARLICSKLLVYDTVYAGGATRLVEDAAAAGARAANGLSMLLHQGALSFEIWFNRPAPLEVMRQALFSTQ